MTIQRLKNRSSINISLAEPLVGRSSGTSYSSSSIMRDSEISAHSVESTASVPDALERAGNFSEAAAVEGYSIWDTSNGTNNATDVSERYDSRRRESGRQVSLCSPESLTAAKSSSRSQHCDNNNYLGFQLASISTIRAMDASITRSAIMIR